MGDRGEPEFRLLGYGFADRGRRADETLRLMRALWEGRREFGGEYWSFENAYFGPLPNPPDKIGELARAGADGRCSDSHARSLLG